MPNIYKICYEYITTRLNYNNNSLLNIQFRSLLGPRGLLYIYKEKTLFKKTL